jgi:phosphate transport system permease protein
MIARGFGTAATLLVVVLVLFVLARALGGKAPGNLTKGQQRAANRQSLQDLARIEASLATNTSSRRTTKK